MVSFDETERGRNLRRAIESKDSETVAEAVAPIVEDARQRKLEEEHVTQALKLLKRGRHFTEMVRIADVAMATDRANHLARTLYAQALTDTGLLHAGRLEMERLLADAGDKLDPKVRGEALGLLGRNSKQRFVNADPASEYRNKNIRDAVRQYATAYKAKTDPNFHGVNLVALLCRARAEGIALGADDRDPEPLIEDILMNVQATPEANRGLWDRATEIELLLAKGDKDAAVAAAERLVKTRIADAFHLGALSRQLVEVWRLEPTDPLMLAIDESRLCVGGEVTVELPNLQDFEKLFGSVPIGYETYRRGLEVALSVAMITDRNNEGWGTGFAIPGSQLHDKLGDELLLVTNSHVSSSLGTGQLMPSQTRARFEVARDASGTTAEIDFSKDDELFTSPPHEYDCTIFRVGDGAPVIDKPIRRAAAQPTAGPDAYVYVIGHPMRGGLSLSIRGNDLLAVSAEKARMHYRAPTQPGSSGSPVFSPSWDLVGLHHAGSQKMPSLTGGGSIQANEGITITAIREAFMKARPNG